MRAVANGNAARARVAAAFSAASAAHSRCCARARAICTVRGITRVLSMPWLLYVHMRALERGVWRSRIARARMVEEHGVRSRTYLRGSQTPYLSDLPVCAARARRRCLPALAFFWNALRIACARARMAYRCCARCACGAIIFARVRCLYSILPYRGRILWWFVSMHAYMPRDAALATKRSTVLPTTDPLPSTIPTFTYLSTPSSSTPINTLLRGSLTSRTPFYLYPYYLPGSTTHHHLARSFARLVSAARLSYSCAYTPPRVLRVNTRAARRVLCGAFATRGVRLGRPSALFVPVPLPVCNTTSRTRRFARIPRIFLYNTTRRAPLRAFATPAAAPARSAPRTHGAARARSCCCCHLARLLYHTSLGTHAATAHTPLGASATLYLPGWFGSFACLGAPPRARA